MAQFPLKKICAQSKLFPSLVASCKMQFAAKKPNGDRGGRVMLNAPNRQWDKKTKINW